MARLSDVGAALKIVGPFRFVMNIWREIGEDSVLVWAAAMAYSWLFAVFPFLIFLLTMIPYLPQNTRAAADREISDFIHTALGKESKTIIDNIHTLYAPRQTLLWIGIAVTLWAASGGMSMTMSAIDECYDIAKVRPFYRQRPIAILLTLFVVFAMLVVLILMPIGSAVETWLKYKNLIGWPLAFSFNVARYAMALVLLMTVLAVIYHFGRSKRGKFVPITPGALFSILVWILMDLTFRFYIDRFARYDKTYGTVGGAAILLLFFYIDAVVLLIGAEINSEVENAMRSRSGDETGAAPDKVSQPTAATRAGEKDAGEKLPDSPKAIEAGASLTSAQADIPEKPSGDQTAAPTAAETSPPTN